MAQNDYRWGLTVDHLAHSASKPGAHYSKNWDKAKQKKCMNTNDYDWSLSLSRLL